MFCQCCVTFTVSDDCFVFCSQMHILSSVPCVISPLFSFPLSISLWVYFTIQTAKSTFKTVSSPSLTEFELTRKYFLILF